MTARERDEYLATFAYLTTQLQAARASEAKLVIELRDRDAQLQAAQATIAAIEAHIDRQAERGYEAADSLVLRRILSRADTSALAAVKAESWDEGAEALADYQWSTPSGKPIDPPPNPYRASIEEEGADRG